METGSSVGDCEDRLANELRQQVLRDLHAGERVHGGQLRIVDGVGPDDVEVRILAGDHHVVVLGLDRDRPLREGADDVAEDARAQDDAAGLRDRRLEGGVEALRQIVARELDGVEPGLDQNALQRGDGAFRAGGLRRDGDGGLKLAFGAGEFHMAFLPFS